MKRRLLSIAASILVLSSMAFAAPVSAAGQYSYPCVSGLATTSTGFTWTRPTSIYGAMTGAKLDIVARALDPCTNGDATHPSKSFELVTMEGSLWNASVGMQIGIGKSREYGVDQTYFYYTPADNSGGDMQVATWANFPTNADRPVGGVTYTFRIELEDVGGNCMTGGTRAWQLFIKNTSTGVTVSTTVYPHTLTPCGTPLVGGDDWWGCETGTTANALGTDGTSNPSYMQYAGYRLLSDGLYHYTQNSDAGWHGYPFYQPPSYYHLTHDQGGPSSTDRVSCNTSLH
jgi:hypothetical protein